MKEYLQYTDIPECDLIKPRLFDGQIIKVFDNNEEYLNLYPENINNEQQYSDVIENIIYNKAIELDYLSINDVTLFDIEGGYWKEEASYFKLWQSSLWNYYYENKDILSIEDFIVGIPAFNFNK